MKKEAMKFTDSAVELFKEVYDISGGAVVVTELPETGDEHTIYELRQEIPADFSWLLTEFDRSEQYPLSDYPFIVVETEDQVTQEYLAMPGGAYDAKTAVFVKNTNNVYECYIEAGEQEDMFVKTIVFPEEHNLYGIGEQYIAILKDFDYHVAAGETEEPNLDGTGHFLDGAEFNYDGESVPLVLTEAKNPIRLGNTLEGYRNCKNFNDTTELPTAKQAVDGNMCNGDGDVYNPEFINIKNKLIYFNETKTDTYSWNYDNQKFGEVVEDDEFIEYLGELEWATELISVVNKIDINIFKNDYIYPVFNPQQAHTEISYWIYTNNEWMNIDEIPDPNLIKIGITCTNGNYNVLPIQLDSLTIIYDDVVYKITQYAKTVYQGEAAQTITYYGYIEVPMPTQENLTHTIEVVPTVPILMENWVFSVNNETRTLNSDNPIFASGICSIKIFYQVLH